MQGNTAALQYMLKSDYNKHFKLTILSTWIYLFYQELNAEAKVGDDTRRAVAAGAGRVQHGAAVRAHTVREEQHTGAHQLPQQQETPRQGQGVWQVGY